MRGLDRTERASVITALHAYEAALLAPPQRAGMSTAEDAVKPDGGTASGGAG